MIIPLHVGRLGFPSSAKEGSITNPEKEAFMTTAVSSPIVVFLHLTVALRCAPPPPALLRRNGHRRCSRTFLNDWLLRVLLSSIHHLASPLHSIMQSVVRTMMIASMRTCRPPPPPHRPLPQHVGDLQLCSGRDASHLFVRYSASNATRGPTILVIMCHLLYRGKYGACYQMPLFPTRGVINQTDRKECSKQRSTIVELQSDRGFATSRLCIKLYSR
jgi:hypothetical protein